MSKAIAGGPGCPTNSSGPPIRPGAPRCAPSTYLKTGSGSAPRTARTPRLSAPARAASPCGVTAGCISPRRKTPIRTAMAGRIKLISGRRALCRTMPLVARVPPLRRRPTRSGRCRRSSRRNKHMQPSSVAWTFSIHRRPFSSTPTVSRRSSPTWISLPRGTVAIEPSYRRRTRFFCPSCVPVAPGSDSSFRPISARPAERKFP